MTSITDIIWTTTDSVSCDSCLITYSSPQNTATYEVEIVDANGCVATDQISIAVYKPRDVYIPSAFSPNGDGINDIFFVNAGQEVVNIKSMKIFSRWGEMVFERYDLVANDPDQGWKGLFKGELTNPGVFVYVVEVEFIDGWVELYKGDVTLFK